MHQQERKHPSRRRFLKGVAAAIPLAAVASEPDPGWPSFRGPGARGVADGYPVLTSWNADAAAGPITGLRWRAPVPGIGHSSPIVWGERIYIPSAIRTGGKAPLRDGPTG